MIAVRPLQLSTLKAGSLLVAFTMIGGGLTGCQDQSNLSGPTGIVINGPKGTDASKQSHDAHPHEHPTEGPHHGVLIELGNEDYHAELVHDDATGQVTVYILDGHATKAVPVDAAEVVINLKHGDAPEQYKLPAQSMDGEPTGQASRFSLTSQDLAGHLHDTAAGAKLSVTVGGIPYSGAIPADSHDHAGHKH